MKTTTVEKQLQSNDGAMTIYRIMNQDRAPTNQMSILIDGEEFIFDVKDASLVIQAINEIAGIDPANND
jgi:hypothetical protein